jgi:glycosyltransferase involved in cell wall biosynthesis
MRKILWVSSSPIGPASRILDLSYEGQSGGWIQTEYETIDHNKSEMFFLTMISSDEIDKFLIKKSSEGTTYAIKRPKITFGLKPSKKHIRIISEIINIINPDVIQIWGTESFLSHAVIQSSEKYRKIIYVQGLIGMHKRYYNGYLNSREDKKYYRGVKILTRLKDIIRHHLFVKQSYLERYSFEHCKNVIIDNDFGKAYIESLSSQIRYFTHQLLPNQKFNQFKWELSKCDKNSIFTVFGITPDKGIHQLLKALKIVKRTIPEIKLYIPGNYPSLYDEKLRKCKNMTSYEKWIYNFLIENELTDNVVFVGKQNLEGMISHFLKCRVFVNPSCMEVHASTLREAITLGVPTISALSGSIADYLTHDFNGMLYRYEEDEILAYYILKMLNDDVKSMQFSLNSFKRMKSLKSTISLEEIYDEVLLDN